MPFVPGRGLARASGRAGALGLAAALGILFAGGCGDDEPSTSTVEEYDDPEDFERRDCVPGSMAGVDPTGIWHQDIHVDGVGSFAGAHRIDPADDGGWRAYLGPLSTSDVRLGPDDLFLRWRWTTTDGTWRVRAFDACRRDEEGRIAGVAAFCAEGEGCVTGRFVTVKVERRAGEGEAEGVEKLGEWNGDPAAPWGDDITVNVRVRDGVAYLVRYTDGLRIVDVSDPAAMRDLGWAPVGLPDASEVYNDVKIVDAAGGKRYALVASNRRGAVAIDVTDPTRPVEVATFPPEGRGRVNVHTLFTETIGGRTVAYLANITTLGLDIYDVTDPAQPMRLGAFVHPDAATTPGAMLHDLYVENGRAYLSYWALGMVIVDTRPDPANPVLVGAYDDYERRTNHSTWVTTTSSGRRIAVTGDEDWDAHVHVVDVDPASPTFLQRLGELRLRPEVSVHNIMAFGDKAYVAWYQDGLRILDVSDPTNPTQRAYFHTWRPVSGRSFFEGAIGLDVDVASGLIYVADTHRGLVIVRETR